MCLSQNEWCEAPLAIAMVLLEHGAIVDFLSKVIVFFLFVGLTHLEAEKSQPHTFLAYNEV